MSTTTTDTIGVIEDLFVLSPQENWEYPDRALIEITWMDETKKLVSGSGPEPM